MINLVSPIQDIGIMRLTYRGISYEVVNPEIEAIAIEPIGMYRGAPINRKTLRVHHAVMATPPLKYRGSSYTAI